MKIKTLRESKGKTQEELAKNCKVTRQAISNLETSGRLPSVSLAKLLAVALDCNWTDFYTEDKT